MRIVIYLPFAVLIVGTALLFTRWAKAGVIMCAAGAGTIVFYVLLMHFVARVYDKVEEAEHYD